MSKSPKSIAPKSVAYLGPPGTNSEAAALAYLKHYEATGGEECLLCPLPTIAQTLRHVAQGLADKAVVPVENSLEGSVPVTLDTLWQLDRLSIRQALVLPISHALISPAQAVADVVRVYSHPQALAQCQEWLEQNLPKAQLIPTNSTSEAVVQVHSDVAAAAIAPKRAAELYGVPVLAHPISDRADNFTRFWVVSRETTPACAYPPGGTHTSLGFSFPANVPGTLVQPMQVFASRGINLSRIESRPTKRELGEYLFFIDIECDIRTPSAQTAIEELTACTETLKIFGSYNLLTINPNT
ncbi:MAG TPA: prephenate dehydratase [Oscillatoriaceae cyanobacterium M33_DOE_052]|uniref:Prephenate dehydratase n=1 Tax=Planktothricoides sp. SpSt-374 TaxID=2282167 RepID=A0A7C3VL63_9CYAN|nr:prephenate dehydratase [Oscillatoriaceae cyanobacterium M33_DOE_052]